MSREKNSPLKAYQQVFVSSFEEMAREVNEIAHTHGFWNILTLLPFLPDKEAKKMLWSFIDGTKLALTHSELGECTEATRKSNPTSKKIPPFTHAEEELADCIIRIMDYAHEKGFDIGSAIIAKMNHNRKRPYLHDKEY